MTSPPQNNPDSAAPTRTPKHSPSLRVRLFGAISILFSCAWYLGAYRLFRHILRLELMGLLSGAIRLDRPLATDVTLINRALRLFDLRPIQEIGPLEIIEATAHIWMAFMGLIAFLILVSGIVAALGRSTGRRWHLATAVAVLAGTLATFAGIFALVRWGQFPPMRIRDYLIIAAVQSFYAWILIPLFLRRPIRSAPAPIDRPPPDIPA